MIHIPIRQKRFKLRIKPARHASFYTWEQVAALLISGPAFNRVA